MIEQDFNYADSTIKELTDLFETRVENLEPKEGRKISSVSIEKSKKSYKKRKKEKGRLRFQSPAKNQPMLAVQLGNISLYTENAVILQTTTRIYVQWSASTSRKRKKHSIKFRKEHQRAKCSNGKEISEICEKQEKGENREGASAFSRNADFR